MHKQENKTCIYELSKFFSPFLSIHQQRGENKSNNKDIYAIYIHEEDRREVSFPCIHALHEEGMTTP